MTMALHPPRPILIIDDEPSILLAIDTTLQMAGLNNTITCQDSRQVMDLLADTPIESMLLDLNMPNVDGHRLLDDVRREYPDVPVIIVTGAVDVETAVRCIKAGAFDYIVKPVEADRLITAVNRAIAFQELRRENQSLRRHMLRNDLEHPEIFQEHHHGQSEDADPFSVRGVHCRHLAAGSDPGRNRCGQRTDCPVHSPVERPERTLCCH